MNDLFSNIFLSGLDSNAYNPITRKVILLNILLVVCSVLLSFFSIYNLLIVKDYLLGAIDLLSLLVALYAFFTLRRKNGIALAASLATLNVFILMIALVYFGQGRDFTLIWTVFLPIFAIFINGSKKGLIITFLFYIIVFTLAYLGVGEWQDGHWSMDGLLRLVGASIGLTIITYFFERSFEFAYEELEFKKEIEERYIIDLEQASITDPLTQLYNRRYLDIQFSVKFEKAKKNSSYFALFILDLDFFKSYNDTYGHIAGDSALQDVSSALRKAMRRESDSTFRLGGEEFCALLIAESQEKIISSVENVRKAVKNLKIKHHACKDGILSVSIGVCIINSFEVKNFDKMYKIADNALYIAKEEGRDCVRGTEVISTL